jgi:hypothetical protein
MAPTTPSATSIPFFYRIFFTYLDPIICVWGALSFTSNTGIYRLFSKTLCEVLQACLLDRRLRKPLVKQMSISRYFLCARGAYMDFFDPSLVLIPYPKSHPGYRTCHDPQATRRRDAQLRFRFSSLVALHLRYQDLEHRSDCELHCGFDILLGCVRGLV